MRWCAQATLLLALVQACTACGPGRGVGRRRGPKKLIPLVFKQHIPNVSENTVTASGLAEGRISRNDTRFKDLVPNYNQDIIFKDEEGTGADRLMTQRCKEKLNTLAISVMNQWPGIKLLVTEGWDEEGFHQPDSLHYEGRAVDIMTSDRDRSKYGMLARLAVEAGFDWVYYEARSHIHCSVKLESSQGGRYGGCFPPETTVLTPSGRKPLVDLHIGESVLSRDPTTHQLVFSEVILFLDYDPNQRRQFLKFTLLSGRTLTVTPAHLILTGPPSTPRTVYADSVHVGDALLVNDGNGGIVEDRVVGVSDELRRGVYAPLTVTGTVVVNDVVASCYATVDSQGLAHWAFLPLRVVWNAERGLARFWSVMKRPLKAWSDERAVEGGNVAVGVHWYAKMLYVVADFFIPRRLHE